MLEGTLNADLEVELVVGDGKNRLPAAQPAAESAIEGPAGNQNPAKLSRAAAATHATAGYAARGQHHPPERGPVPDHTSSSAGRRLIGHSPCRHSGARGMCSGTRSRELRNTLETEMSELASGRRSVRTVKEVLNSELVKRYFLRYRVRRVMTPNGVRTAGILLQVRMDDPLTPEDQQAYSLPEEERWYSAEFEPLDDD